MPPLIPIIGLIAGEFLAPEIGLTAATAIEAGAAAAGTGWQLADQFGGSGGSSPTSTTTPTTPNNYMSPTDISSAFQSILQGLPDQQFNTGGGTSAGSEGSTVAGETGNAGNFGIMQQAINAWLGLSPGATPGTPGASPDFMSAIAQAQGQTAPGTAPPGSSGSFNIQKFMRGLNPQVPGFTLQNNFGG